MTYWISEIINPIKAMIPIPQNQFIRWNCGTNAEIVFRELAKEAGLE